MSSGNVINLPLRNNQETESLDKSKICGKRSVEIDNQWKSIADQQAKTNPSWIFDKDLISLKVRGAPLIATVGMFSLICELNNKFRPDGENASLSVAELSDWIHEKCDYLVSARPTAINLIINFLYQWQNEERGDNDLLIKNSISCLVANALENRRKLVIMTICNTGALATSSFGTALGWLGRLEAALALETRPYNQGSRLTAYELTQSQVPFYLLPDSAAAYAMNLYRIDAILVGCDCVALNGDTANKIGTYSLAVLAKHHRIPFYVITPTPSININIQDGTKIHVEQRPANELIYFNGKLTAPENCPVWNPAFDVTPNQLITGILTEKGNFAPENLKQLF